MAKLTVVRSFVFKTPGACAIKLFLM